MKKLILWLLLAALTSSLLSCTLLPPAVTIKGREYTCMLYGENSLNQIKIKKDGKVIGNIKVQNSEFGAGESAFEFIDMNFDGHDDFRIVYAQNKNGTLYRCWIWDPATKTFSVDKTLNKLLSPVFDAESETITAGYFTHTIEPSIGLEPESYTDERGVVIYGWRQNNLVALRRECTTYYGENDYYCVAVWEINSEGELEPVSERWFTPEQYERAGYPPIG